jgi:hypothetical protein
MSSSSFYNAWFIKEIVVAPFLFLSAQPHEVASSFRALLPGRAA